MGTEADNVMVAQVAIPIMGAKKALEIGSESMKQGKKLSIEYFGYDFPGLSVKIIVYYAIMWLFHKYLEAMVFGTGFFATLMALASGRPTSFEEAKEIEQRYFDPFGTKRVINDFFGLNKKTVDSETEANIKNTVSNFPELELSKALESTLSKTGLTYWDIVNVGAALIVMMEAFMYHNNNKNAGGKGSPFTYLLFAMVIGFTVWRTIYKLAKNNGVVKESTAIKEFKFWDG